MYMKKLTDTKEGHACVEVLKRYHIEAVRRAATHGYDRIMVKESDLCVSKSIQLAAERQGGWEALRKDLGPGTPGQGERETVCDHQWDGPRIALNETVTVATCSRCGISAAPELTNAQRPGAPGRTKRPAYQNQRGMEQKAKPRNNKS